MFNPQRKSKVSDIYMQQKIYKLHLAKMYHIGNSQSPRSKREQQQEQQERYLNRLQKSKKQIRERMSSDVRRQNKRLLSRLVQTDHRHSIDPQKELPSRKDHFNSYFSTKRQRQRIHKQNYTLVMRMDQTGPDVPSRRQLKKQYKQSRRYKKNCRKLPSIAKYEQQFKKKLSTPLFSSGVHSNSNSKAKM